ncbi:PDZ domain-containing protein [Lutibacter sp.]|uniref:PDZ domain-containing protein n=1 Tax=Lutibacter sp. TaxID=1925666 RepID=UPI003562D3FE
MNFILDSGVGNTILFNINHNDSIPLFNTRKIRLQGLGKEDAVEAVLSEKNIFKLNNIIGKNQRLYVIFDDSFDLSSKVGLTIHGIIGFDILKDFVVIVNYGSKKLTFISKENYKPKKCNKCETFPLEFNKLKAYIDVGVILENNPKKVIPVKLLIDSGGSDSMWLFEGSLPEIVAPKKYFNDFLGEGLSGSVHGKRSIIEALIMGKFKFKKPTVSFPDSVSVTHARKFEERNGSIGAEVLKRFTVIFNYPNSEITFKKGSKFNAPFRYNMSGIELVHNGKVLVREQDYSRIGLTDKLNSSENNTVSLEYRFKYAFKPSYKIQNITEGSPAHIAGLQKGDIIIKINGKYTYGMKLEDIVGYFFKKENTKINLLIERNNQDYSFSFRLKNALK